MLALLLQKTQGLPAKKIYTLYEYGSSENKSGTTQIVAFTFPGNCKAVKCVKYSFIKTKRTFSSLLSNVIKHASFRRFVLANIAHLKNQKFIEYYAIVEFIKAWTEY